jgi:quinol monooxygenase YgiN
MFARVTTFQADASRLAEMEVKVEELKAATRQLPGIEAIYSVWGTDGRGVVTAIYKTKADADNATPQIRAMWAQLQDILIAPPQTDVYDHVERMA